MSHETILTRVEEQVAVLTLNRTAVMNALNRQMMLEVNEVMQGWDHDDNVRAIIITGSDFWPLTTRALVSRRYASVPCPGWVERRD